MYYIFSNNEIKGCNADRQALVNSVSLGFLHDVEDAQILETDKNIYWIDDKFYFEDDPEYIEKHAEEERARLDALTLTPADVERALYKEKEMDFEDLKELIIQRIPQIDVKALSIEFRAKDFYRGAMYGNMRLFDVVGALLGYTSNDMDYLFEHKELPNGN